VSLVQLGERPLDPEGGEYRSGGVVAVGDGAPKRAITASPMYFSTWPPYRWSSARTRWK
jgi:hypothetical protein